MRGILLILLAPAALTLSACRASLTAAAPAPAPAPTLAAMWTTPPPTAPAVERVVSPPLRTPLCTSATCPATARLRPSDGWAFRETWRRRPRATPEAERLRCACEARARKRSWWLAGAGLAVAGIYGATVWDQGNSGFDFKQEGWFGEDTTFGGADKLGHAFTGYAGASIVSALHRDWGLSRKESAWRGAATSMVWMTGIEIGDALSDRFGFSFEDLAADAAGCLAAYFHDTSPWFHRTIDFRWEYWPSERGRAGEDTPTDDYDGSAFLVAVNAGALLSRRPTGWDLLDLQVGYQARGYLTEGDEHERWIFVGLGLNLANLLRRLDLPGAYLFEYYQLPFISLRLGFELGDGDTQILYAP